MLRAGAAGADRGPQGAGVEGVGVLRRVPGVQAAVARRLAGKRVRHIVHPVRGVVIDVAAGQQQLLGPALQRHGLQAAGQGRYEKGGEIQGFTSGLTTRPGQGVFSLQYRHYHHPGEA